MSIAFPAAKVMVEHAIERLTAYYKGDTFYMILSRYFGPKGRYHIEKIVAGYKKILAGWQTLPQDFSCTLQADCPTHSDGVVLGFVRRKRRVFSAPQPYGDVHICTAAFGLDPQKFAALIVHELSHRLDNTDDKEDYYCDDITTCSTMSPEDAIDNADSYAEFARALYNNSL